MQKETRFTTGNETTLRIDYTEIEGGIQVNPVPITPGESVTIIYNGMLADKGTGRIYLHTGYGDAAQWSEVKEYEMLYTGRGWEKSFHVPDGYQLHFCFRDDKNNWDSNNGRNWSYRIHNG